VENVVWLLRRRAPKPYKVIGAGEGDTIWTEILDFYDFGELNQKS
jgi:hypothetical protein